MRSEDIQEGMDYHFHPHHEVGQHPSHYMKGHIVHVVHIKLVEGDGFHAPHFMVRGAYGCLIEALPEELEPLSPTETVNLTAAEKLVSARSCWLCWAGFIAAFLWLMWHTLTYTPGGFYG